MGPSENVNLLLLFYSAVQDAGSPIKRASSFIRIGRHRQLQQQQQQLPFGSQFMNHRGYIFDDDVDNGFQRKRMSSFVRIGKRLADLSDEQDRVLDVDETGLLQPSSSSDKRATSSFVRIGRR